MLWLTTFLAFLASITANKVADVFLDRRIAIIGSFAGFHLSHNPGVAFGVMLPPVLQSIMIAAAVLLVLLVAIRTVSSPWNRIAFGLILGGALGNIIDRLADGLVTDYVQVGSFPIFNIADSCITIGAVLVAIQLMRKR